MADNITVLICTHNRVALLEKTLHSLNAAKRPPCSIEIVVVANACDDGTHAFLDSYPNAHPEQLPLRWIEEPTPGKSHALNRAIPQLQDSLVAMVDDDHRVHPDYLMAIFGAFQETPEADICCGRIVPDWDGTEAAWLHDKGPYAVYPLPIPDYQLGPVAKRLGPHDRLPGGGNIIVRHSLFGRVGPFSTALGPSGHDLNGGEDIDFVRRALELGARLAYSPYIVQYHFVDPSRLQLIYILKKAFYRSRSATQLSNRKPGRVPRYLWRKLGSYLLHLLFSLYWPETRFYLMRCASTLGEASAYLTVRTTERR